MAAVEAAEHVGNAVQPIDAHRLEIGPEDGLHRPLPAAIDAQLLRDARLMVQRLRLQPLRHLAGNLTERSLLKGFGGYLGAQGLLPLGAQRVESLRLPPLRSRATE